MRTFRTISLLTLCHLSLCHSPVEAGEWDGCNRWPLERVTMRANLLQFVDTPMFDAFDKANDAWRATATDFEYTITLDNDFFSQLSNGESEIFLAGSSLLGTAPAGVVRKTNFFCMYSEADLLINVDADFELTTKKAPLGVYNGFGNFVTDPNGALSFGAAMVHELGHVQGLDHEDAEYNVMGDAFAHLHTNGSHALPYVGEDAAQMSVAVYGEKSVPSKFGMRDFALSHWKRLDSVLNQNGDLISRHTRTSIFRNGINLGFELVDGEPMVRVPVGTPIDFELTVESMGEFSDPDEEVKVKFYLSKNDFISKYDSYLGSATVRPGITGNVQTLTFPVTLPVSMPVGADRFLGAIINPGNINTEVLSNNNATYIHVRR